MDVWVLPSEALLQVAEPVSVGLQIELPSSKLVRLEENPVPYPLGRDRLLEFHLDELAFADSGILPRTDATLSEGALLRLLGVRRSMPITDSPPGVGRGEGSAP